MMQILYILLSPKYERLGISYLDSQGNPVQFIEKCSITNMQKFQPEEAGTSVDNVIAIRIIYSVQLNEQLFDLTGNPLNLVFSEVEAETQ